MRTLKACAVRVLLDRQVLSGSRTASACLMQLTEGILSGVTYIPLHVGITMPLLANAPAAAGEQPQIRTAQAQYNTPYQPIVHSCILPVSTSLKE
jgi:hypothetical protein